MQQIRIGLVALALVACGEDSGSDGAGGASGSGGAAGTAGSSGASGSAGAGGSGGESAAGGAGGAAGGAAGAAGTAGSSGAAGAGAGTGGQAGTGGTSGACLPAQPSATYIVTFDAVWSSATHPDGFPPGPHFSGLIGATHDDSFVMWEPGALATPGIESMAETGAKSLLSGEIAAAMGGGGADTELSQGGINPSPGSVSLTFTANAGAHWVSLVSMIAPSPDWFVGVHGLSLCENDGWAQNVVVDLLAYDAGTDSGATYTAANADTVPPEPIAQLTGSPFVVGGSPVSLGTFTFARQ